MIKSFLKKGENPWEYSSLLTSVMFAILGINAVIILLNLNPYSLALGLVLLILFTIWIIALNKHNKSQVLTIQQRDIACNAYDSSPYAYIIFNSKWKAIFFNKVLGKLLNSPKIYNFEDFTNYFKSMPEVLSAIERLRKVANIGESQHIDIPVNTKKDLSEEPNAWWRISVAPMSGDPEYNVWCFADITPSRKGLLEVAQDPIILNMLVNKSPGAYFILDNENKILYANNTFLNWINSTKYEITGKSIYDLLEDSSDSFMEGKDKKTITFKIAPESSCDFIVHRVDKENESGNKSFFALKDFTRDGQLENELNRSKENFENIFAYAPLGIVTLDSNKSISSWNHTFEEMFEDYEKIQEGSPFLSLITSTERDKVSKKLMEALDPEHQNNIASLTPINVNLVDQKPMALAIFINSFHENSNNKEAGKSGWILYFIDTTEQKRLEIQFVQSQKMQAIGQLAGGIAHDFNNLLTAMIGFCDLLLLRHPPTDPDFNDLMQIKQNSNRAANLVRQLLAFSRQQTLQAKVINITDTLAELSELLRRLLGASINLEMNQGRDLGLIRVDPGQLEQVIINLSVNARDAMAHGGVLNISTKNVEVEKPIIHGADIMEPGEYLLIEVKDTGTGIRSEHLSRIFEPFFSTKELGSGTGLGLSTVYGIVRQTGGFISVESTEGVGTTFKIYFPIHQSVEDAKEESEDLKAKETIGDLIGKGNILLVEDEDAVRLFSTRALTNKGYTVIEAPHAEAAIEYIENPDVTIDLMITDIVMPKMDGLSLIKIAKNHRPNLKLLFISGYTEDNFRQFLDQEQEDEIHFLSKPFSLNDLASKVKEIIKPEEEFKIKRAG